MKIQEVQIRQEQLILLEDENPRYVDATPRQHFY
jgi:hypothetical protein